MNNDDEADVKRNSNEEGREEERRGEAPNTESVPSHIVAQIHDLTVTE